MREGDCIEYRAAPSFPIGEGRFCVNHPIRFPRGKERQGRFRGWISWLEQDALRAREVAASAAAAYRGSDRAIQPGSDCWMHACAVEELLVL